MSRPLQERFWAKVEKGDTNECWLWVGATLKSGYGYIDARRTIGRLLYAHRLSWEFAFGEPADNHVLHKCDNPPCVNPSHLFLGTQAANTADMVTKGRHAMGMKNGRRKLSADDVRAIRALAAPNVEIAERFGLHANQVYRIKHRISWRALP